MSSSGASLTASHWSHEELGPADAGFIEVKNGTRSVNEVDMMGGALRCCFLSTVCCGHWCGGSWVGVLKM